jgi:hypothetical protein
MAVPTNDEILHAAFKLQERWPDLLGAKGATAARSLIEVAGQDDEHARQVANLMLDLFDAHDALDELRPALAVTEGEKAVRLSFHPLPGQSGPVAMPGILYRCPVRGCHVTWEQQVAGQTVPFCAVHPDHHLVPCPEEAPDAD